MLSLYILLLYTSLGLANPNADDDRMVSDRELPGALVRATELTFPGAVVAGNGLKADYYNGVHFEKKVLSRIESQVNYTWSNQHWIPGLDELNFSARWSGKLTVPVEGSYILVLKVDDGIRLWLGGKLLVDEWHGQSVITYKREVTLKPGRFYDLKIEYFNFYGPGIMQLSWESPEEETKQFFGLLSHRPQTLIPKKYLHTAPVAPPAQPIVTQAYNITTPAVKHIPAPAKPKDQARIAKRESIAPTKPEAGSIHRPPQPVARVAHPAVAEPTLQEKETFENLEIGKAIELKHVLFEQSTYALLQDSYAELDKLVKTLRKYPQLSIEIAGHTDNMGDVRLNQALSENRAMVVAAYLIRNGIAEDRIKARGYGSTQPVADNSTEIERAKNRRVEFIVIK